MNFETLKRSHLKRNIIIGVVAVLVISAVILNFTRAKYRVTESISLVNGTINYTPYDFKMVAMYQKDESGEYTSINKVPSSGYTLNEEESYCEIDGVEDNSITMIYEDGVVNIGVKEKGTKCYLYFDKLMGETMSEIIAGYTKENRLSFSSVYTTATTNKVFITVDWKGTCYYFAGAPTDNWVEFGGFYWRIIRINGDGSTRLIYNGTSPIIGEDTNKETLINNGASEEFNHNVVGSEKVGFKYTEGSQHGQNTDSTILDTLQSWYTISGLSGYASYIDSNVGFCSDREVASGYTWSSPKSLNYAAWERLYTNKSPSLACSSNDIVKEPVGLITADEVAFAGAGYGSSLANSSYYLYNGQEYWTMSPYCFLSVINGSQVFYVHSNGYLDNSTVAGNSGVRPVINLKSDTQFTGSGTTSDPFKVVS